MKTKADWLPTEAEQLALLTGDDFNVLLTLTSMEPRAAALTLSGFDPHSHANHSEPESPRIPIAVSEKEVSTIVRAKLRGMETVPTGNDREVTFIDHRSIKDFRRLNAVFTDIAKSPGDRRLVDWLDIARQRGLAYHPCIDHWLKLATNNHPARPQPKESAAPAEAQPPGKGTGTIQEPVMPVQADTRPTGGQDTQIRSQQRQTTKRTDEELRSLLAECSLPDMNATKMAEKYKVSPQRMRKILSDAKAKLESPTSSTWAIPNLGTTRKMKGSRYGGK
ncbi:hypothetical protein AEMCBJ_05170 [Cupriavidus necator]|uniref:hypothetical protein n=1 Tax=Cupriavidus necator TaxID=106590 RepID=UPI003F73DA83